MTQHATLSEDRWAAFRAAQQVLMIANELNRAGKLTGPGDRERRRSAYERVLNLTDLTVRVRARPAFRRELLRWRDLAASLYVAEDHDPLAHAAAMRALLLLTPESARQAAFLPTPRGSGSR